MTKFWEWSFLYLLIIFYWIQSADSGQYAGIMQMDEKLQRRWVGLHNGLRKKLINGLGNQPKADKKQMKRVKWDSTLANIATNWAANCKEWGHNNDAMDNYGIGENKGYRYHSNYTSPQKINKANAIKSCFTGWANEHNYYDYNSDSCMPDQVCSHYTQLAWAKTTKIGCGIAYCKKDTNYYGYVCVCNYKERGNMGGKPYPLAGQGSAKPPKPRRPKNPNNRRRNTTPNPRNVWPPRYPESRPDNYYNYNVNQQGAQPARRPNRRPASGRRPTATDTRRPNNYYSYNVNSGRQQKARPQVDPRLKQNTVRSQYENPRTRSRPASANNPRYRTNFRQGQRASNVRPYQKSANSRASQWYYERN